ncbi:MAG: hypothetical protein PHV06_09620, partial [bacterium]|nr:hypothetical protein [bacterium]
VGRFTGKDSLGYPGYEYVKGNPMKNKDNYGTKINIFKCFLNLMTETGSGAIITQILFQYDYWYKDKRGEEYGIAEESGNQDNWAHCVTGCLGAKTEPFGCEAIMIATINREAYFTSPDWEQDLLDTYTGCTFAMDTSKTCEEKCADWIKNKE